MFRSRVVISILLSVSASFAWVPNRFNISSFCDPFFVWPDQQAPLSADQTAQLDRFADANFNTMTGWICADQTVLGSHQQPDGVIRELGGEHYVAGSFNELTFRHINDWNLAHPASKVKIKRFINSVNFDDLNRMYYSGLDYSSTSYITQQVNRFSSSTYPYRDAVAGWFIGDEPVQYEVDKIKRIMGDLKRLDPSRMIYMNHFPVHGTAFSSPLDYTNFINSYAQGGADVVGMDHYGFLKRYNGSSQYFQNFAIASDAAKRVNAIFWPILLSTGHGGEPGVIIYSDPTPTELKYQVMVALGYGAKSVGWYTYRSLIGPVPYFAGFDVLGSKRDAIKSINGQLLNLGDFIISLKHFETLHGSSIDPNTDEKIRGVFNRSLLRAPNAYLLAGIFKDQNGDWVMMVGNKNLSNSETFQYSLPGLVSVQAISKSTVTWYDVPMVVGHNRRSQFQISVGPGDYEFLRLKGSALKIHFKNRFRVASHAEG